MKFFYYALREINKNQKKKYTSLLSVFTALFFPFLDFIILYLMFSPFLSDNKLLLLFMNKTGYEPVNYLFIGYICYTIFFSFVQTAWAFSMEKSEGTFHLSLLSKYGFTIYVFLNSISSIIENVWSIIIFFILSRFFFFPQIPFHILIVSTILLIFSGIIWGFFINALLVGVRNSFYYFYIFQQPTSFFSGVRFPIKFIPLFFRAISYILPLYWIIDIIRSLFIEDYSSVFNKLLILFFINIVYFLLSIILVKISEINLRKKGKYELY